MPHRKLIKDKDPCFVIDPITRAIKNTSATKTTIMQYDHNSERFTFTLPKTIEGHDMMECNKVEIHYINIESSTKEQNDGIYTVTDLQPDTEDATKLKCSWLISQNATKLSGSLNFLLRFSCVAEDGTIEYAWNSGIFAGISVTSGLYNSEVIVEQYADVLEQWKKELENSGGGGGAVSSVNGKTGAVELRAEDVDAYTKSEVHYYLEYKANQSDLGNIQYNLLPEKADKATTLSGYGITDAYTKKEAEEYTDSSIMSFYNAVLQPEINERADKNLSNVDNGIFLNKLNEVLPDGDEVSY